MTRPELERLEGVVRGEKLSRPELDGRAIADAWCLDETPDGWALFLRSEKGWPEGAPDVYQVLDDAVDALIERLRADKRRADRAPAYDAESRRQAHEQFLLDISHEWSRADAERIIADEGLRVNFLTDHPEPQRYSLLALDDGWAAGFTKADATLDLPYSRRFTDEREAISFFIVRARLYLRSAMNQAARVRGEF